MMLGVSGLPNGQRVKEGYPGRGHLKGLLEGVEASSSSDGTTGLPSNLA